jgi:hypothetical protein
MWVASNSLEFIKILKIVYVLVIPILFIGDKEKCKINNNNNTYNESKGGTSNST